MNTIVLEKPGQMRLMQTEPPRVAPPGHALVRVHRVGICGTDWHAYHGRQPFFSYPRILGHELGVTIEQISDPQSPLRVGDRCAVEPYFNCGKCIACRRGKGNCCANLQTLGVHIDGGMRELIVVPADKLHKSDVLSLEQLALVEMLGIGCHAVERGQMEQGEWALILGAGPIGMSIVPFAQAAGARVIVADMIQARLDFCKRQLRVQHAPDAAGLEQRLHELTGPDGPTVVFDATGNAQSMARTFDLVAPGGRIVFVGLFQGDLTFNDPDFHRKEITLLATRNATSRDFVKIIRLVEDGRIDTMPWITHRAPCEQLVQMLPSWLAPDANVIKAMVEF